MAQPVQSTPRPVTPTQPRHLPTGISPIVHHLPKDKADRLRTCKKKANSRTQFTRKVLAELFNADELSASNMSRSANKVKLDENKIGLVDRKYFQFMLAKQ